MKPERLRNLTAVVVALALTAVYFVFRPDSWTMSLILVCGLCTVLLVRFFVMRAPLYKQIFDEMWGKAKAERAKERTTLAASTKSRTPSPPVRAKERRKKPAKSSNHGKGKKRPTPPAQVVVQNRPNADPPPVPVTPPPVEVVTIPPAETPAEDCRVAELERKLAEAEAKATEQAETIKHLLARLDAKHAEQTAAVAAERQTTQTWRERALKAESQSDSKQRRIDEQQAHQAELRRQVLELATAADRLTRELALVTGKATSFVDMPIDALITLCTERLELLHATVKQLRQTRDSERTTAREQLERVKAETRSQLEDATSDTRRKAEELAARESELRAAHQQVQQLTEQLAALEQRFAAERDTARRTEDSLRTQIDEASAQLKALRAELETPMVLEHPLTAMQSRVDEAFRSLDAVAALLQEPGLDRELCFVALLLHPDAAQLIQALHQQSEERVAAIVNDTTGKASEEAWGPFIAVARFVASSIDRYMERFVEPLAVSDATLPIDMLGKTAASLLLVAHLSSPTRFVALRQSGALLRLLSQLPVGVQKTLAQHAETADEKALLLLGGSVLRRACLTLAELARLDPATVAAKYNVREAFPGHRANDPQKLRYKRWLVTHVIVKDREYSGGDLFTLARKEMNEVYGLNEGQWRELVIALIGSTAQPHNHQIPLIEGWGALGFDPRNLLFFLDPSEENCQDCGLATSHIGHFVALSDLVDPRRTAKGELDCYLELFEHLVRTRGIERARHNADHRKDQTERYKGMLARAQQSMAA